MGVEIITFSGYVSPLAVHFYFLMAPAEICFVPCASTELSESNGPNCAIVICGESTALKEKASVVLRHFFTEEEIPPYTDTILSKSCNSYSGSKDQTILPRGKDGSYTRLSFLRIPSECSRHNCPTRPDVVYDKLPSLLSSENKDQITSIRVVFLLPNNSPFTEKESAVSFAGALGRSARIYSRKKPSSSQVNIECSFFSYANNSFCWANDEKFLKELKITTESVRQAAGLVDQPCNECNTTFMVNRAKELVEELGADETVTGKVTMEKLCIGEDLEAEGFGGIFGVGKAAANPPALVVLKYEPNIQPPTQTVAWVGKGIVYDTGGLSMKTKTTMPGMKRDMGGSAAILEAFRAAARIGSDKRIYAVLCLAENAVGRLATRPDDIHRLYSGVTVEINNTDAEGRLVVGDGVAYVSKHLNVDVVLDMCTLTGAQGIATGQRHSAIVCNEETMEDCAVRAGRQTGDLCHPMPYSPELFTVEFKSSVADMKNSVKNRNNAQPSCAGHFIGSHLVDYQNKWIHVDMAGPSHKGELATGYGVLLLLQMFGILQN